MDIDKLRSLIDYDPETGAMVWKAREITGPRVTSWNARLAGKPALAHIDPLTGYACGNIFSVRFQAHRVLWALHYGEWPEGQIDHVNHNRSDNRISNLRSVSHHQNCKNQSMKRTNTSGHTGVLWEKRKKGFWYATIHVDGKARYLGGFRSKEDAIACRLEAEQKYGYHPNHGKSA